MGRIWVRLESVWIDQPLAKAYFVLKELDSPVVKSNFWFASSIYFSHQNLLFALKDWPIPHGAIYIYIFIIAEAIMSAML